MSHLPQGVCQVLVTVAAMNMFCLMRLMYTQVLGYRYYRTWQVLTCQLLHQVLFLHHSLTLTDPRSPHNTTNKRGFQLIQLATDVLQTAVERFTLCNSPLHVRAMLVFPLPLALLPLEPLFSTDPNNFSHWTDHVLSHPTGSNVLNRFLALLTEAASASLTWTMFYQTTGATTTKQPYQIKTLIN